MTTICVASGKGGTGKTMLAVALATLTEHAAYVDCDVEAPDGALFLHPHIAERTVVQRTVARVDSSVCRFCGDCAEACAFNAIIIAPTRKRAFVFDDLCTGCGLCSYVCPANAVYEVLVPAGEVSEGSAGSLAFREGRMSIEAPHAHPTLEATLTDLPGHGIRVLDAEPGSGGRVLTTLGAADVCLLVAEPTPFGLHDLRLAAELTAEVGIPRAVIINRSDIGDDSVAEFCRDADIPVLLEIPFDPQIARTLATGGSLLDARPELRPAINEVLERLVSMAHHRSTA